MMKHFLLFMGSLILTVSAVSSSSADKIDTLQQHEESLAADAIEAASQAKQAAAEARVAAQAAEKAAARAEKLAQKSDEIAYHAYLAGMARKREARVALLPPQPAPPEVTGTAFNAIDRFVMAKWPEGPEPQTCDDHTFLRRIYMDALGIIPSATEVQAFLDDRDSDKRAKWIDKVLARDEDYAVHWIQFWEDALCSNGKHQGGVGTRGNFRDYIYQSFQENKPYDIFVAQLIDPNSVRYRGGYVRSDTQHDSLLTAASIGQVFLGTKMKCATCHDDFLNYEWTQQRFYQFGSFFSSEDLEIVRCEEKQGVFVKPAFIFDNSKADAQQLDTLNGRLAQVTKFLVDPANPRFAAAFVNRLWKRYMGLGIVEPVDEFREDTPPANPELLAWLSHEFVSNGYDIKHMIRTIMNSRTYQLQFNAELADIYQAGRDRPRYFRSPSLKKLTCEQFIDSVAVALGDVKKRLSFDEETTALTLALGRPATRNEVSTQRQDDVVTLQALEYMNGPDLHGLIADAPLPERLADADDAETGVDTAFMRVLSRHPRDDEKQMTLDVFGPEIEQDEWADILWALVVSPEFQYVN